jgi:hypothetical protein
MSTYEAKSLGININNEAAGIVCRNIHHESLLPCAILFSNHHIYKLTPYVYLHTQVTKATGMHIIAITTHTHTLSLSLKSLITKVNTLQMYKETTLLFPEGDLYPYHHS